MATYINEHDTVVHATEVVDVDAIPGGSHKNEDPQRDSSQRFWFILFTAALAAVGVGYLITNQVHDKKSSQAKENLPTSAPTAAICPEKRIRITEVCDVPDLDDDIFGNDVTMDIKILINDKQYWPKDFSADCIPSYGSYDGSCVIPDTSLVGCFQLKNSIDIYFDDESFPTDLKVTIYDEDIFTDDFIDILIPVAEWFHPGQCEQEALEFQAPKRSARIKMVVDSVTEDEGTACGATMETITAGLSATSQEFEKMQTVLQKYVTPDPEGRRRLFFGALISGARFLISGVSSFGSLFARGVRSNGPLSTLADFTTIGSALFSQFGPGDESSAQQKEMFDQVFQRFDQIDTKLDGIQSQLKRGFEAIELVIQEEFAKQELDEWINVNLAILNDDYRAYLEPTHTATTRVVYEEIFRNSCRNDHSPFTTFKVLYSHSCSDCQLLDGKSQQYILDTFVDLSKANFDDLTERIIWFRQSFGTVIIAALTQAIYLHSVCLYQPEAVCQNEDPVWYSRLEEMGEAMEEVALSLTETEEKLQ